MTAPRVIRTTDRDLAPGQGGPRLPVHLVCDDVRSAYNAGAFFRCADACRAAHLHLCGITAYPPNPKLAKTALGTPDHVPWTWHPDMASCARWLRDAGVSLFGVEVTDRSVPLWDVAFPAPVALVFGHEVHGLGAEALAHCEQFVELPMAGVKNSLNVAIAAGVVLYEVARQYSAAGIADLRALPVERGWGCGD